MAIGTYLSHIVNSRKSALAILDNIDWDITMEYSVERQRELGRMK